MQQVQKYREVLVKKGLKSTRQRNAVLEVLEQSEVPVTADCIYLKLREMNVTTCLSTIYRTLEVLVSKEMVIKSTIMDDSKAKYAMNHDDEHSHHLICIGCTKIVKIDECPLKELEKSLHDRTDFDVTGHKLEVYGYCPQCKNR